MSSTRPLTLTFGIEIECLIECTPAQVAHAGRAAGHSEGSFDREADIHIAVCALLTEAGIPTIHNPCGSVGVEAWKIERDGSIRIPEWEARKPGYEYLGMELISRVLPFCEESFREIEKVLARIRGEYGLVVNQSTGLHVHLGNEQKGFEIATIKRLSTLVIAFEHVIDSVHSTSRVYAEENGLLNDYCKPNSVSPNLEYLSFLEQALEIESCESLWQVREAMQGGADKKYAYNFLNMFSDYKEKVSNTIEFRQHEGTVDASTIIHWVKFLAGIVHFCHEVTAAELTLLWARHSADPSFTVLDLMKAVGQASLVNFYTSRLHHRHRRSRPIVPKSTDETSPSWQSWQLTDSSSDWSEYSAIHEATAAQFRGTPVIYPEPDDPQGWEDPDPSIW